MPIIVHMDAQQLFKSFEGIKILVVGDVMIDAYIWGKVERISPEAPVPVLTWQQEEQRLGGAANVALNLKALGAEVLLCSVIGTDEPARAFKKLLKKEKLSDRGICTMASRRTTVKTRMIAGGQHLLRVDKEDSHELDKTEEHSFVENTLLAINNHFHPDVILFQDYNKGLLTEKVIQTLLEWAAQQKIPTVVDPKYRHFFAYQKCSLFKPNLKEVNAILREKITATLPDLSRADVLLRKKLKHGWTMITLSEKGVFMSDGQRKILVPTAARTIADVCGAGDTVVSVAALGMATKLPMDVIALLSNLAGGQVCELPGVVAVDRERLMREVFELLGS
jgi:D-glycero-beta-D-manno-heptose-7-phosphate kinase